MYEKVLVVSGKPSWNKEHSIMRAASFRRRVWFRARDHGNGVHPFQRPMHQIINVPMVHCAIPLDHSQGVFYQTLETPYSRNEATMRECQRELSQILKSISPLTVEKKVCFSVCEQFYSPKEMKGFLPV